MASPFFGTSNRSFLAMFLHVIQGACWGKHVFFQMESWLKPSGCFGYGSMRGRNPRHAPGRRRHLLFSPGDSTAAREVLQFVGVTGIPVRTIRDILTKFTATGWMGKTPWAQRVVRGIKIIFHGIRRESIPIQAAYLICRFDSPINPL